MKFLVDQQLPPTLARWLVEQGYEAQHVRELGMRQAPDQQIWDHALVAGAVIVTKDRDFAEWAVARRPRRDDSLAAIWQPQQRYAARGTRTCMASRAGGFE